MPQNTNTSSKKPLYILIAIIAASVFLTIKAGHIVAILVATALTISLVFLLVKKIIKLEHALYPALTVVILLFSSYIINEGQKTAEKRARQEAIEQKQREEEKRKLKEENLKKMPALLADLKKQVSEKNWEQAEKTYVTAKNIEPNYEGLSELWAVIAPEIQKINLEKLKKEHSDLVKKLIIEVTSTVNNKELCQNLEPVARAWNSLRQIKKEDPEYIEAQKLVSQLEKCRLLAVKKTSKDFKTLAALLREQMADFLETKFLDDGMDMDVRVSGTGNSTITFQWVLINRVLVHKLQNETTVFSDLEKSGFKKIVFTDGYFESFSVQLQPTEDSSAANEAISKLGLSEPLSLPN